MQLSNLGNIGTAAMENNNVDDFDDFNSFLETVLSDCDEPPATPAVPYKVADGPKDGVDTKVDMFRQGDQEASTTGGVERAAGGDDVAAVPLTADDFESTCSTGVFQILFCGQYRNYHASLLPSSYLREQWMRYLSVAVGRWATSRDHCRCATHKTQGKGSCRNFKILGITVDYCVRWPSYFHTISPCHHCCSLAEQWPFLGCSGLLRSARTSSNVFGFDEKVSSEFPILLILIRLLASLYFCLYLQAKR